MDPFSLDGVRVKISGGDMDLSLRSRLQKKPCYVFLHMTTVCFLAISADIWITGSNGLFRGTFAPWAVSA